MGDQFKKLGPPVVVAHGAGVPQEDRQRVKPDPVMEDLLRARGAETGRVTLYGVLMELRDNFRKVMAELSEKYKGGISEEDANYAFERVLNDFLMKNAFGDRVLP